MYHRHTMKVMSAVGLAMCASVSCGRSDSAAPSNGQAVHVDVVFSGGHETDPRDKGRPVILVASALGVPADVFREAFSHVKPAPAGERPDPEQVRRNKEALLGALAKYGVTNERLDEVSDYYRYRPGNDQLWKNKPASAYALVEKGVVTGFVVTDGGAGYSSSPTISVPGYKLPNMKVEIAFGKMLEENGAVTKIALTDKK